MMQVAVRVEGSRVCGYGHGRLASARASRAQKLAAGRLVWSCEGKADEDLPIRRLITPRLNLDARRAMSLP